ARSGPASRSRPPPPARSTACALCSRTASSLPRRRSAAAGPRSRRRSASRWKIPTGRLRAFTFVRAAWCAELMPKTAIEAMLERESAVVLAALVLLILLAWYAVLAGAGTGRDPVFMRGLWLSSAAAPAVGSGWTPGYWAIADDAAERLPYGAALCARRAAGRNPGTRPESIGFNCCLCRRLYCLMECLQPFCGCRAVDARAHRSVVGLDELTQPIVVRRAPYCRWYLSADAI